MAYNEEDLCISCGAHYADPHAPGCDEDVDQPATIAALNAMDKLTVIAVTTHTTL